MCAKCLLLVRSSRACLRAMPCPQLCRAQLAASHTNPHTSNMCTASHGQGPSLTSLVPLACTLQHRNPSCKLAVPHPFATMCGQTYQAAHIPRVSAAIRTRNPAPPCTCPRPCRGPATTLPSLASSRRLPEPSEESQAPDPAPPPEHKGLLQPLRAYSSPPPSTKAREPRCFSGDAAAARA